MSATWSRLLAATWVLVALAHGFVSVASRRTGKPLWWVDNSGIADGMTPVIGAGIVYALMLAAFVVALRRAPWSAFFAMAAALALAASAAVDVSSAPGSAIVALAAAASAFVAAVAGLAGRTGRH